MAETMGTDERAAKRRKSELDNGVRNADSVHLEAFWWQQLEAVSSSEGYPPMMLTELHLRREVLKLREHYRMLMQMRLGQQASLPRESFNRWMLERANRNSVGAQGIPVLPFLSKDGDFHDLETSSHDGRPVGSSAVPAGLYQEIIEDIPIKVPNAFPTDMKGQKERLRAYASAVEAWTHNNCPEAQGLIKECQAATSSLSSGNAFGNVDDVMATLASLRKTAAPWVARCAGPKVASLCLELEAAADAAARSVRIERRSLIDCGAVDAKVEATVDATGRYVLRPIDVDQIDADMCFAIGTPVFERLSLLWRASATRLECRRKEKADRSQAMLVKLVTQVFEDGSDFGGFWRLAFCVLCRHDTLCGPGKNEGHGLHAGVPLETLKALVAVSPSGNTPACETFASALNCRADLLGGYFWSLSPDIEIFFGSLGSFLDHQFTPKEGAFEVNPPFDLHIMDRCATRILGLLNAAGNSRLGFTVFLPEWQTPWTFQPMVLQDGDEVRLVPEVPTPMQRLLESPFCRGSKVVRPQKHSYVHGHSHRATGIRLAKAVSKSRCIVLQTSVLFHEQPPTETFWNNLQTSWRGGKAGD